MLTCCLPAKLTSKVRSATGPGSASAQAERRRVSDFSEVELQPPSPVDIVPPTLADFEMPFGKKKEDKKDDIKKKLQHKLYLAKEDPEADFDLSGCDMAVVPSGIYSVIKVLRKELLLLHDNKLKNISGGGNVKDLHSIKVLDLHNNQIEALPADIGNLTSLQVLNLDGNKLKTLPSTLSHAKSLQTLKLKGNKLKEFPEELTRLCGLKTLDISSNHITRLPTSFCHLKFLENCSLDASSMLYPPSDVCSQGLEAIMKFLCKESGVDYVPPSSRQEAETSTSTAHLDQKAALIEDYEKQHAIHVAKAAQYEAQRSAKRNRQLELEKQLEEAQREQALLKAKSTVEKESLLNVIMKDQNQLHGQLDQIHKKKDFERQLLIKTLSNVEKNASNLISQLLEMNEKARKTEALLETMEKERNDFERMIVIRQEEADHLRKKEVLEKMKKLMAEHSSMETLIKTYTVSRQEVANRALHSDAQVNELLGVRLANKHQQKSNLVANLLSEEEFQKEAFRALQLQKDAKCSRIATQIELIQNELAQLSLVEVDKREMRMDIQQGALMQKRAQLTQLLMQLLQERKLREEELSKRLNEMDRRREETFEDYWLIQYQRLLDKKPQSLIDLESQLETAVVEILTVAGAEEYRAKFARHGITIETLLTMTEDDLKSMGIWQVGVRAALLSAIAEHREARVKVKKMEDDDEEESYRVPSAPPPPPPEDTSDVEPRATSSEDFVEPRVEAECACCMERLSSVIFVPCGHVCCCVQCARQVTACPLCRAVPTSRVLFTAGTGQVEELTLTTSSPADTSQLSLEHISRPPTAPPLDQ